MDNLKKELATGVFYVALAKYSNYVVQLIITAILARLLTPDDYGIVAIAMVFIVFFNLLCDIGIGPAIIQFKELTRQDLSHIFSFTVYFGFIIAALFFLGSWLVADYYGNPVLVPVCQLLSTTIFFNCVNIVPQNIQYKNKRFRFTAGVTLVAQICSAIIAVIMALLKCGVYSLVVQQILSSFLIFIIYYCHDYFPFKLHVDFTPLKKIMSFSVFQFLFNIINYFSRNLDKLLVGKYIGLAPLGQYEKSYRLMLMPLQTTTHVVTPVLQPIFSEMQNDLNMMAEKYKKIFSLICYLSFPLSIVLFFTGGELVLLIFGDQWHDAVLPFRILALSVGLQMLNGTIGAMYQSANATKQLFISGCWCAFFMITSFFVAIFGWHTIVAVAIAFDIAQIFNSGQSYYLLLKTLKYPVRNFLVVMIYPVIIALIVGCVLFFTESFAEYLSLFLSLLIKCSIALVVWLICVSVAGPYKQMIRMRISSVIMSR